MDQRGFRRSRRILTSSKMSSSLRSFTISSDGNERHQRAPAQQAKIDRALDREIAFGSDFLPASHVRPNFDLKPAARKIRRSARKSRGRERIVDLPLSKHSTRPVNDQRIYPLYPLFPAPVFRPLFPVRFHRPPRDFRWTQEKRPQVILKNGPSAFVVYGLRIRVEIPSQHTSNALHARR